MNIIDIVIILFILLFGVTGWHNGFIRTVISAVGFILVFVLSFWLKNPIAEWLSLNLPFFQFGGDFKGVTVINIVIYQLLAFVLVFILLISIYIVAVRISKFVERILKYTILLGLPSKILGFVAGIIEGFIVTTVVVAFLSLPVFGFDLIHESGLKKFMLESTPIVGNMMSDTSKAIEEIMDLRDEFSSNSTKDEFNRRSLDIMLKYDIIEVDYVEKLINKGKIKIENKEEILNKYR